MVFNLLLSIENLSLTVLALGRRYFAGTLSFNLLGRGLFDAQRETAVRPHQVV